MKPLHGEPGTWERDNIKKKGGGKRGAGRQSQYRESHAYYYGQFTISI
jgi:hypothetical protein